MCASFELKRFTCCPHYRCKGLCYCQPCLALASRALQDFESEKCVSLNLFSAVRFYCVYRSLWQVVGIRLCCDCPVQAALPRMCCLKGFAYSGCFVQNASPFVLCLTHVAFEVLCLHCFGSLWAAPSNSVVVCCTRNIPNPSPPAVHCACRPMCVRTT